MSTNVSDDSVSTSEATSAASPFLNRPVTDSTAVLNRLEAQIRQLEQRVVQALAEGNANEEAPDLANRSTSGDPAAETSPPPAPPTVNIWGVPFSVMNFSQVLHHVDRLIAARAPGYFITANLNYNMLTARHPELVDVNRRASFIVCDGMPIVWWSALTGRRLPERIAGSELIYALAQWASLHGQRMFFLGGAPGVAAGAARKLQERYPGLNVVGTVSPPYRDWTPSEEEDLIRQIKEAQTDILLVALGQPKGELWLARNCERLGVPVCAQLGASFDFVAGGVARAPRWLQRLGLEWAYRLAQEPRRLAKRYAQNGLFLLQAVGRDLLVRPSR